MYGKVDLFKVDICIAFLRVKELPVQEEVLLSIVRKEMVSP